MTGQDFDHYQRLRPAGIIPQDFLLSSSEKYERELSRLEAESREERKARVAFYQESFYFMNQLLLSGKVLFNDSVSNYVSEVADILLKDQPDLRASLRFYAVKSPSTNAFASNNGLILVNLGLIAKLENEAQLAFVLCHEISHFVKQHPIDIFLQTKTMDERTRISLRRDSLEDIMLAKSNYSREKELEADTLGLLLYLQSEYDLSAVESAFRVLKFADLPFANQEFSPAFFEDTTWNFPERYFLKEVAATPENADSRKSGQNHPSPDIRREVVAQKITGKSNVNRRLWILGERRFFNVQKICRYESVFLHLYYKNYEWAIYHSIFLLQEQPNSFFLKKIIAQSLYGLSKYNNEGRLPEVHRDFEFETGNIQRLHYFMEKLSPLEMNILATIYNWNLLQTQPDDQTISMMTHDLMRDLGKFYVDSLSFLMLQESRDSLDYLRRAMAATESHALFFQQLTSDLKEGHRSRPIQKGETVAPFFPQEKNRRQTSRKKNTDSGFQKVVFVDPFYQRIDERKESNIKFIQSENAEQTYILLLESYAEKAGLSYEMLSTQKLNSQSADIFCDITTLNEWANERALHDELKLVSICHNEIQALVKKYGTSHFIWTGIMAFTYARTGKGLVLTAGIIFPPLLPYSLYLAVTPDYETTIYTIIYNVETGDYQVLYPKRVKMKDNPDMLHSVSYNLIYQLKNP
ncbi:MAG: M48 family metallopeptidase [Bacteroidia bacterium]